ncbi:MAG: GHKL domain-containing protein [Lachnospiraceae bacterium]|nr:GHKL domain-containing protein [Lachnospiraceae bacterium]
MKNNILKRYLIWVLIYTMICIASVFVMDNVFNGVVLDFLYENMNPKAFWFLNTNRELAVFIVYCLGMLILSVCYVFKFNRLLMLAGASISEEEPEIFGENCPQELLEFSQKLKDFKASLKENEQARIQAEQQKNDLVVYLAHDLKTPLTSVVGYLTLLEEAPELPAEQRAKYIGIALDKAYRLEQLINEFFDITRMNYQTLPAYKAPVNLTILLVQIINEFFPMMEEKNITMRQEIEPELVLSADADKMARVFDNLFRNAVNYSHEGTEIVCSARKGNGCILVNIKNKGDQIPQEKLSHIFDKFYRLDTSRQSSTGGAGLGLAIAKQIVELHDGSIEAVCNNGVTEFRIVLPV